MRGLIEFSPSFPPFPLAINPSKERARERKEGEEEIERGRERERVAQTAVHRIRLEPFPSLLTLQFPLCVGEREKE